ncbi:MAG TPA: hypothetical protein VH044_03935 [Polyangiaceae bacterium]|nr:hypothetical protein [Polyangiaceae bacterium]
MATDLSKRLTEVAAELGRQNAAWAQACRALSEIGIDTIAVPRRFTERLDALSFPPVPRAGLRI